MSIQRRKMYLLKNFEIEFTKEHVFTKKLWKFKYVELPPKVYLTDAPYLKYLNKNQDKIFA
jgi:hypothetical protein